MPYYSRYDLNTYRQTPFFAAHVPPDFPIALLIQSAATFHELPPRLHRLASLSREWGRPRGYMQANIDDYYDGEGFELDPETGLRATRALVLDERGGELPTAPAADIPEPPGGFADPATWRAPDTEEPDLVDRDGLTEQQILGDIGSRGREWTAATYGVPASRLAGVSSDQDLARVILEMDGKPWPVAG